MGRRAGNSLGLGLWLVVVAAGCGTSTGPSHGPTDAPPPTPRASAASAASPSSRPASPSVAPTPAPIAVAAASLEPALKQLWQVGGPKPPKDGACCVTVAPDGTIWAAAMYDSAFWIIDANGKYLESWGTQGRGDGEFNFVEGSNGWGAVAFDPDGTFYVADATNHRVQKFDKDRGFITSWGSFGTDDGEFAVPISIASDGHGQVYVLDNGRLDVQAFSSDGTYIRTVTTDVTDDWSIATDPSGHLYVDDGTIIRIFDADGTQLPGLDLSSLGHQAAGMAFDGAGHVFVAMISPPTAAIEPEGIFELDTTGEVVHAWTADGDTIAIDPEAGALYTTLYTDPFVTKLELPKP